MILKLTVLMGLACLVDLTLRKAPAALRHLVWTLAMFCSLLLPVAGLYTPKLAGTAFVIRTSAVAGQVMHPSRFNWVMAIYAVGVAVLLFRLVLDILAANRLERTARPTSLPGVLVSDQATVPFAWRSIVVPSGLEDLADVVAHERAHVERGDVWTSVLARVTCAVFWFHPLVWWAASRMRLEADRACDDAVLRSGFEDAGYAEKLVQIAKTFGPSALAPGAVKQSQVEIRIRHILASGIDRRKLGAAAVCVAALVAVAVTTPVSALSQQDAEVKKTKPRLLWKSDPQYTDEARDAKISGTVLLGLVVGSDGVAKDIHVTRSLDPGLDESAVAAVQQWKFQPATADGEAVDTKATIEVNFRLK